MLLAFITNLGMGGSEAAAITAATNRILVPSVQARNMLLSTTNRTITPTVTKRTMLPKVR